MAVPSMSALEVPPRHSVGRAFLRRPTTVVYLSLLGLLILACFTEPLWGTGTGTAAGVLIPPGADHWAGTDDLGRDFGTRLLVGGRTSILVGVFVAVGCFTLAVVIGGMAGFHGGVADLVLSRISDFFQVVPSIILALVAVALLGTSLPLIIVILSLTHWPAVARILRAECLRVTSLGFVESARAAGFRPTWIFLSEVLPNAMPPVLVATTMTVGRAVLAESALSFLGLGDANAPSWGALLSTAQPFMGVAWWLAVLPGLAIFLVVLSANVLGDNLNDSLNPTLMRVK